jgi:hypothetical protein
MPTLTVRAASEEPPPEAVDVLGAQPVATRPVASAAVRRNFFVAFTRMPFSRVQEGKHER